MSQRINQLVQNIKNDPKKRKMAAVILIIIVALFIWGIKGHNKLENEEKINQQYEEVKKELDEDYDDSESPEGLDEEAGGGENDKGLSEQQEGTVYVDIGGAVSKPGVYEMEPGSRVFEVIEEAGGLLKKADPTEINRAEEVSDGMVIRVPVKGKNKGGSGASSGLGAGSGSGGSSSSVASSSSGGMESEIININNADSAELQKISGVGPSTAEKIIDYRTQNGPFSKIEDIKNVSGIGDKTFEKMREKITC